MDTNISISDDLVLLRPPQPEDVPALYAAVRESLAELSSWMDWAAESYSEDSARNWLEHVQLGWAHSSACHFVITDLHSGELTGVCGVDGINEKYRFCNLGYWVRTSRTGAGIASRSARIAARFAFENLGIIRAEIVIAVGNLASQRAAQKAGAHYEGILKNRMVVRTEVYDAVMYSLSPDDFKEQSPAS